MEYTTNAPKGAALLDERMPGWADRIDLAKFAIEKYDLCILGQLYGMYSVGIGVLFGENWHEEACEYGFNHRWDIDEDSEVEVDAAFDSLQAEWESLVRERRTAQ